MGLLLFVGADLALHGFPVHLEVLAELSELFVCFWLLVHLEEALAVGDHSVHVRLVAHGDFERTVPLVELDVQLDCAVEQTSLQKHVLSLGNLLLVHEKGGIASGLRWQLLDIVNELDFVGLVNRSKRDFDSVELSLVDGHGGERGPKRVLFYESAQADCLLEITLLDVLVQDTRVGRDLQGCKTAIESAHGAKSSSKAGHHCKFTDIGAVLGELRLSHEFAVNVNGVRVEPGDMLAVSDSTEHIVAIVPAERVDDIANLVDLWLVHECQEHIAIVVDEAHFAFRRQRNLVEFHLNDLSGVLDVLGSRLSRNNIENSHYFGRHWVDQGKYIAGERNVASIQKLNAKTLVLRAGNILAIVVIDVKVLACIDEREVLDALHNSVNTVFDIKNKGRSPALRLSVIDVSLGSCAHD